MFQNGREETKDMRVCVCLWLGGGGGKEREMISAIQVTEKNGHF